MATADLVVVTTEGVIGAGEITVTFSSFFCACNCRKSRVIGDSIPGAKRPTVDIVPPFFTVEVVVLIVVVAVGTGAVGTVVFCFICCACWMAL